MLIALLSTIQENCSIANTLSLKVLFWFSVSDKEKKFYKTDTRLNSNLTAEANRSTASPWPQTFSEKFVTPVKKVPEKIFMLSLT